ncbi:hypothetical protein ACS0TY_035024 [Phlomoides rotata]
MEKLRKKLQNQKGKQKADETIEILELGRKIGVDFVNAEDGISGSMAVLEETAEKENQETGLGNETVTQ